MVPKGGTAVWGSLQQPSPDDPTYPLSSLNSSTMLTIEGVKQMDLNVDEAIEYMLAKVGTVYWEKDHNVGFAKKMEEVEAGKQDPSTWDNALMTYMPKKKVGSQLSVYCIYGVGKMSERSVGSYRNELSFADN
jgi:hypothetical protein